jgi:hypothetical protein
MCFSLNSFKKFGLCRKALGALALLFPESGYCSGDDGGANEWIQSLASKGDDWVKVEKKIQDKKESYHTEVSRNRAPDNLVRPVHVAVESMPPLSLLNDNPIYRLYSMQIPYEEGENGEIIVRDPFSSWFKMLSFNASPEGILQILTSPADLHIADAMMALSPWLESFAEHYSCIKPLVAIFKKELDQLLTAGPNGTPDGALNISSAAGVVNMILGMAPCENKVSTESFSNVIFKMLNCFSSIKDIAAHMYVIVQQYADEVNAPLYGVMGTLLPRYLGHVKVAPTSKMCRPQPGSEEDEHNISVFQDFFDLTNNMPSDFENAANGFNDILEYLMMLSSNLMENQDHWEHSNPGDNIQNTLLQKMFEHILIIYVKFWRAVGFLPTSITCDKCVEILGEIVKIMAECNMWFCWLDDPVNPDLYPKNGKLLKSSSSRTANEIEFSLGKDFRFGVLFKPYTDDNT